MSERLTPEREAEIRNWFEGADNACSEGCEWVAHQQRGRELSLEIDRLREDNKALLMTIELLREGWDETIAENKALREALNDVDAKATLASQMCTVRAYADGFTVIADFARAALERTSK